MIDGRLVTTVRGGQVACLRLQIGCFLFARLFTAP